MSDSAAATRMPVPELVGVFGGTFDPIHRGHLDTVSAVREACSLDRVLFVPASTPPHRDLPGATAQQRLEMVALAIADYPSFVLDDREFQRTEPSYTFDTLQALASDLQEAVCCFIMGVDAFLEFESWHRWREVLELANFIVDKEIPAIFVESSVPVRTIEAVQAAVAAQGFEVDIGGSLFSDAMGDADTPEGHYTGMVRHNIDTIVSSLLGEM